MKRFNIHITKDFEENLKKYMKQTGIKKKAEAIRRALREAVARNSKGVDEFDFRSWIGAGLKCELNKNTKFKSEDDLW
ncbi:MAG: hypothetical protein R3A13_11760 [Bdellovibrionota bacterium]